VSRDWGVWKVYKGKTILGLIPARGGSKGLPRKNVALLAGKPLIAWTIEQARSSRYLDRIVVSSDDSEIMSVAGRYGAEVPFRRPAALAADDAGSIDTVIHSVEFFRSSGTLFDYLVLLEPTSPLREAEDIDNCVELLVDDGRGKSVVSVSRLEGMHPAFNVVIDGATGFLRNIDGGSSFTALRRQDLPDVYYFEGTVYMSEVSFLLKKKTFYHELTLPYVVPKWKAVEIDDIYDLVCAEAILKMRSGLEVVS